MKAGNGIVFLALLTLAMAGLAYLLGGARPTVLAGLVVLAGLHTTAAFAALLWSLAKSDRTFFTIFAADGVLRLVVLSAVTYGLWIHRVAFTAPLLTLALAYLLLSVMQIPFFRRVR